MSRRIHINPWRTSVKTREFSQMKDSTQSYEVDYSSAATERGTTVSSVDWSTQGTRTITFANKTLTNGVASADLSSEWGGYGLAKVKATYADGATETIYFEIDFKDPEHRT